MYSKDVFRKKSKIFLHLPVCSFFFRSLSCQRISLHKNMFLSFILNSIVTIMWLSLTVANNQAINTSNPVSCLIYPYFKSLHLSFECVFFILFLMRQNHIWGEVLLFLVRQVSCKILAVLTQYTSTSNYFWMLCEGIYLHTLIIVAVFVGEQQLFWYYVLGWGESGGSVVSLPFPKIFRRGGKVCTHLSKISRCRTKLENSEKGT